MAGKWTGVKNKTFKRLNKVENDHSAFLEGFNKMILKMMNNLKLNQILRQKL